MAPGNWSATSQGLRAVPPAAVHLVADEHGFVAHIDVPDRDAFVVADRLIRDTQRGTRVRRPRAERDDQTCPRPERWPSHVQAIVNDTPAIRRGQARQTRPGITFDLEVQ
jgi:hypothetical protein